MKTHRKMNEKELYRGATKSNDGDRVGNISKYIVCRQDCISEVSEVIARESKL